MQRNERAAGRESEVGPDARDGRQRVEGECGRLVRKLRLRIGAIIESDLTRRVKRVTITTIQGELNRDDKDARLAVAAIGAVGEGFTEWRPIAKAVPCPFAFIGSVGRAVDPI